MSFADSSRLESQSTPLRRQDDATYRDDPEFDELAVSLSEKLFSLTANINQLSRQISLLGTRRETERVRERVQTIVEDTGAGFKEIGEGLKRIGTWPDLNPRQKYSQDKLAADFRASLSEFQLLSNQALQKQRASKAAIEAEQAGAQEGESQGQQGHQLQQQQQQQQVRLADQSEVDFQESLIIERESEIRQIEQSVGELNELFRDVATMVHEQGFMVDSIEQNVETVRDDTAGADRELRTASRYQKSARGKMCCLLLILAVVVVIVVLAGVYG